MRDLFRLIVWAVVDLFRSRAAIEAEILTLRQQIIVLRRTTPKKQSFGAIDRLVFVGLYRLFPRVLDALAIVRPETVIKWHRAGFRFYWHWEVATSGWPANSSAGNMQTDPRDEHRQPTVGSATDPWRAAQARHRDRTDQRGQIYGQAKRSAVPRVEDVPPQSCRRHRRDGYVRRADNLVPPALWFVDHGAWQTTGHMVRSNNASDRGMDRKPVHGSLRMGAASPLSDPRSRWSVWRSFHPTTSVNGHSRSADAAAFPMAKRICRTADRFDPTRPSWCSASATSVTYLCLSEIKSGHIRDAIRRGPGGKEYALPSLRCAIGEHPCPKPSACASRYSSERKISESGVDVPRLRQ